MGILKKIILILVLINSYPAYPQTKLPSFFSNNMVLQQNKDVAFWGTDDPEVSVKVSASWGDEAKIKTDKDGKWKLKIKTPEAGGPYTVTVKGSDDVILTDVLIGEVWLCSGQSNMEMAVKGFRINPINGSNEAILNSSNNQIRLFHTKRNRSLEPLADVDGQWFKTDPSTVGDFSAAAYFFGKKLNHILNVPIGLIHTSWGGSIVEAWTDKETLAQFDHIVIPTQFPIEKYPKSPIMLYNAMLHPFIGYELKGFIWYQGESNHQRGGVYQDLFSAMIRSWRQKWEQPDLPFYFVQIAPYNYDDDLSPFLREAQLNTMQTVENTGMVVTMDIGDCADIHPREKKIIGDRLAYWALAKTYNIANLACSGPVYKEMEKTDDGMIQIIFDYAPLGCSSFGKELIGFEIAGEDKVFHPARAKITRKKPLLVWSENVNNPVAVRYGFKDCGTGTLYNIEGLPASPFRTDNWEK